MHQTLIAAAARTADSEGASQELVREIIRREGWKPVRIRTVESSNTPMVAAIAECTQLMGLRRRHFVVWARRDTYALLAPLQAYEPPRR